MESMEEVYKAEAEARGKKIKQYIEVLSYCKVMLHTVKINANAREQIIERIDEVLKDE